MVHVPVTVHLASFLTWSHLVVTASASGANGHKVTDAPLDTVSVSMDPGSGWVQRDLSATYRAAAPSKTCGYITGNEILSVTCAGDSYCYGLGPWLGCCSTASPVKMSVTTTITLVTIIPGAPLVTTAYSTSYFTYFGNLYSVAGCQSYTACYPSTMLQEYSSSCSGVCASNSADLLWYAFPPDSSCQLTSCVQ